MGNVVVLLRTCGSAIAKEAGKPARVIGKGVCRLDQSGALALLPVVASEGHLGGLAFSRPEQVRLASAQLPLPTIGERIVVPPRIDGLLGDGNPEPAGKFDIGAEAEASLGFKLRDLAHDAE